MNQRHVNLFGSMPCGQDETDPRALAAFSTMQDRLYAALAQLFVQVLNCNVFWQTDRLHRKQTWNCNQTEPSQTPTKAQHQFGQFHPQRVTVPAVNHQSTSSGSYDGGRGRTAMYSGCAFTLELFDDGGTAGQHRNWHPEGLGKRGAYNQPIAGQSCALQRAATTDSVGRQACWFPKDS